MISLINLIFFKRNINKYKQSNKQSNTLTKQKMPLRLLANTFSPGLVSHVIKRRISWHPFGITSVRRFVIEPCDALPKRELNGVPESPIKKADPDEANPFKIPEATVEELTDLIASGISLEDVGDKEDIETPENFIDWQKYQVLTNDNIEQNSVNNYNVEQIDWSYMDQSIIQPINQSVPNYFKLNKGIMRMWCE